MKKFASKILTILAILLMIVGVVLFIFTNRTGLAASLFIYGLFVGPVSLIGKRVFSWWLRHMAGKNQEFYSKFQPLINPFNIFDPQENKVTGATNVPAPAYDEYVVNMAGFNIHVYTALAGLVFLAWGGLSSNIAYMLFNGIGSICSGLLEHPVSTVLEIAVNLAAAAALVYIPWIVPKKQVFSGDFSQFFTIEMWLSLGALLADFIYDGIFYTYFWTWFGGYISVKLALVYVLILVLLAEYLVFRWFRKLMGSTDAP